MYALDAKTGKIVWEFYLVPKGPDDPTRGPQGATPLDTSTWGNKAGIPITFADKSCDRENRDSRPPPRLTTYG
jgi:PQQ enzyme repeat